MKKMSSILFLFFALSACEEFPGKDKGEIRIMFAETLSGATRAELELPDTNDFILKVSDMSGEIIYEGLYGDSPEVLSVPEGKYTVSLASCIFDKPAFSSALFGDEKNVEVSSGENVNVRMECAQLNSGVRLDISPAFLEACPGGVLLLKSDKGSLMYSYSEKRIAYFHPGKVSLILSESGEDEVLMTRWLEPREICSITVSVSSSSDNDTGIGKGITVALDTSRFWTQEEYVIGGNGRGESADMALSVQSARSSTGKKDVWIQGYIVGGDLTNASASFEEPFSSRSNILLGSRPTSADRESCLAVQLLSGDVRDGLNLVDNPELLGRRVCLKGDLVESYFGLVGIKNVTEYKLD